MTTIITDGKKMVADRHGEAYGISVPVKKIHRLQDKIIGTAGCQAFSYRLLEWYKRGAKIEEMPDPDGTGYDMLVISEDGIEALFKHGFVGIDYPFFAIGSGADFALTAAHLGNSLEKSVEIASELDHSSGRGFDVEALK